MKKKRCSRRDPGDDSFAQFEKANRGKVWNYFSAKCQNKADVDDMTQETFVKLWPVFNSLSREKREPYMWKIARNVWRDYCSKRKKIRKRRALATSVCGQHDASTRPHSGEKEPVGDVELHDAIARLTTLERKVVNLRYFSRKDRLLTHSAVAARLGKPAGTIRSAHSRAMRKLHFALGSRA